MCTVEKVFVDLAIKATKSTVKRQRDPLATNCGRGKAYLSSK
jgi:hypothetical protein